MRISLFLFAFVGIITFYSYHYNLVRTVGRERAKVVTFSSATSKHKMTKSLLLPPLLEMIKRGEIVSPNDEDLLGAAIAHLRNLRNNSNWDYRYDTTSSTSVGRGGGGGGGGGGGKNSSSISKACSCQNPNAKPHCCLRRLDRFHKMGVLFTQRLLGKGIIPKRYFAEDNNRRIDLTKGWPKNAADFRITMTTRNIYDSIISNYLYHKSGMECWRTWHGEPKREEQRRGMWATLSYEPDPPPNNRSFCRYLEQEPEEKGIRVMIEMSLRHFYLSLLNNFALAKHFPSEFGEIIRPICFENFIIGEDEERLQAMKNALAFLNNSTTTKVINETAALKFLVGTKSGGHGSSHDSDLRKRLLAHIEKIDKEYYNGDVAWLNKFLPCQ